MMDKTKAANDIIAAALPLVVFDGWNQRMLGQAALDAGYKKTDVIRVFPGGALDAVDYYAFSLDKRMEDELGRYNLETMKFRQKVSLAVKLRIEAHAPHKEATRRTAAFLSLPLHTTLSLRILYRTVDSIWHAVGDSSTDFSFYTKRLTLAGIYSSTLLHWLDDDSPASAASWEFLERRIDNVMQIGKLKSKLLQPFQKTA